METSKTLEDRVTDLEAIYTDIPEIMGLRFQRTNSQLDEISGRLGLLDKQMAMLMRDMRDLRGGVTRQLVEQDKRIARVEQRLERVEGRLDGVEARLDGVEARLGGVETRLDGVDQKLGLVSSQLTEVLRRLPG